MYKRIERKRGEDLPEGSVFVGHPSKFKNPFKAGKPVPTKYKTDTTPSGNLTQQQAVDLYRTYILNKGDLEQTLAPLKGTLLIADWTDMYKESHADVLVALLNELWGDVSQKEAQTTAAEKKAPVSHENGSTVVWGLCVYNDATKQLYNLDYIKLPKKFNPFDFGFSIYPTKTAAQRAWRKLRYPGNKKIVCFTKKGDQISVL